MSQPRIRVPEGLRNAKKIAVKAGWTITVTGKGHLKWTSPTGAVVRTSQTPRTSRAIMDAIADLRKIGLRI